MLRRRIVTSLVALAGLVAPHAAHAGFFPADSIDGPTADIRSMGDVDVARDGTGAVAYVKRDGGVEHVYVSRLVAGSFQAPERLDVGLDGPGSEPAVAAGDGGRVAVVFINSGVAFATVCPAPGQPWTAPQQLAAGASAPAADMSINGAAYATFAAGGDLRAARLQRRATSFELLPSALDMDATRDAGRGDGRSRVAVSADGTALAVWSEAGRVIARRLRELQVSTLPQDITVGDLEGHTGAAADSPDVDIEDDSSFAWVAFRQTFTDGSVRAVARRLRGSRFEDPVLVDGLAWGGEPARAPRIDLNGRGVGLAAISTAGTNTALASILKDDVFAAAKPLGGGGIAPAAVGAVAETTDSVVSFVQGPAPASVHARFFDDKPELRTPPAPGPDATISHPDFGGVDPDGGFDASGDRGGDVAIAFIQENGDGRRLVVGRYDRAPGTFRGSTTTRWRKYARPPLSWSPAFELWGPLTYRVEVDGQVVGQTTDTKLTSLNVVPDGLHRWRVVATDPRGQTSASPTRNLRVDATPPKLKVTVKRRRGRVVRIVAKASEKPSSRASGLKTVRIDFGDGSPAVLARRATHRYRRGRTVTIRVSATDNAGAAAVVTKRVRPKR